MLSFKKEQIELMVKHAIESFPNECCGLIAGKDDIVYDAVKMKNEQNSPIKYSMNSRETKDALDELDSRDLDLLGVYHSHPTSRAYPSDTDIRESSILEVNCMIISLLDKDDPEVKNFKIIEGEVIEEPYLLID